MSGTFQIRLVEAAPDDVFTYYDHTEEQAGDEPREVTPEWSDHDLADLDRVMSMLATTGHRFEVRGLTLVQDPMHPQGHYWDVDPRSRKATSPQAIHAEALAALEAEASG